MSDAERFKNYTPLQRTAYQLGAMEYLVELAIEQVEVAMAQLPRKRSPETWDRLQNLVARLRSGQESFRG